MEKIGPKERQVRELREQREAMRKGKRKTPSASELRQQIARIKPAKTIHRRKGR